MEQAYKPGVVITVTAGPAPKDRFGRPCVGIYSGGAPEWQESPMTERDASVFKERELSSASLRVITLMAAVNCKLATKAEVAALNKWEIYLTQMSRVNTKTPAAIVWSENPEGIE